MLRSSLVCLALVAGSVTTATAETRFAETIVHNTTTSMSIKLDQSTVLCSTADYGSPHLKVLIPKLGSLTLLDHQNTGAGAPCVAAGACVPGNMPEDILDEANPIEQVSMHVRAVRADETDAQFQSCETSLVEHVTVTIRGKEFKHERRAWLGSRQFSDCVIGAPIDDDPADRPGTAEETPSSGCSATSGGASSLFALALGALVALRRRRRS
jgi:uncharacterized protein (TIGR03382 family)